MVAPLVSARAEEALGRWRPMGLGAEAKFLVIYSYFSKDTHFRHVLV